MHLHTPPLLIPLLARLTGSFQCFRNKTQQFGALGIPDFGRLFLDFLVGSAGGALLTSTVPLPPVWGEPMGA